MFGPIDGTGRFRSDLYYRLHIFPLPVPPLRARREDIALLVRHFVDEYARRMDRRIEIIPPQAIEALTNYSWPGNVRELQNFIERSVILSPRECPASAPCGAERGSCPDVQFRAEQLERNRA
jgi:formate hydrogenlyase transcriptional activator